MIRATNCRILAAIFVLNLTSGCALRDKPNVGDANANEDKAPGATIRGDLSASWGDPTGNAERDKTGVVHKNKEQLVFRTKEEMLKVWKANGGADKKPPRFIPAGAKDQEREVDFGKEMVVAVFGGEVVGQHTFRIERIVPKGNGIVVKFREVVTNGGAQMIDVEIPHYWPCCVVVVDKVKGPVEFSELPPEVINLP
jgi:hypothetical protein